MTCSSEIWYERSVPTKPHPKPPTKAPTQAKAAARRTKDEPGPAPSRKERALQTRRRILQAAYHLFRARGLASTTMDAIASEAGVAVQTLYFTFHTKAAILNEVLGAAVVGFERWTGPPAGSVEGGDPSTMRASHAWFAQLESEQDARRALALFVEGSADVLERVGPLLVAMAAGIGDPDVKAIYDSGERRRAEAYRSVVQLLAKKEGGLKRGVTVARATDVLLVLSSGETWHALRAGRGWTQAECRRWLVQVLEQQLLDEG